MPPLREIVRHVRHRLPFGPPVNAHDSALPYVPRRPAVDPVLPVADMTEAIAFYRGLGFDVRTHSESYAWVTHCSWEYLHLSLVDGLDPAANSAAAYVHVDDVDRWHGALDAASPGTITPLADQPWGMREFTFTDPSGNFVRFGQHL